MELAKENKVRACRQLSGLLDGEGFPREEKKKGGGGWRRESRVGNFMRDPSDSRRVGFPAYLIGVGGVRFWWNGQFNRA